MGDAPGTVPGAVPGAVLDVVGPSPPWQLGLATTVLAGVLLWVVTGRLRLRPETRAASTALFACGALLWQMSTDGVDGRVTLLLAAAAVGAASAGAAATARCWRCSPASAPSPSHRSWASGCSCCWGSWRSPGTCGAPSPRGAVGPRVCGARGGRGARDPARPARCGRVRGGDRAADRSRRVAATLAAATVLVGGVLWGRQPWVRPPVGAVGALAACLALPGPGPTAVLPVTAGIAVLGAVLVEECRRLVARPVLVAATMAGIVVTAGLLPAVSGRVRPTRSPRSGPPPTGASRSPPPPARRPVSFAIPTLDVRGPLGELSQADNGELLAPDDPGLAGWYAGAWSRATSGPP